MLLQRKTEAYPFFCVALYVEAAKQAAKMRV
jgi:hypothetical protein